MTAPGTGKDAVEGGRYGTAAALVLGPQFFPSESPVAATLAAFATFTVGFLARPLGGVVMGHYGDRVGRKHMLMISLLLMGVATALIGLLPNYASIGVLAPALLVFLRFVQGFAVGGELGGAVLMSFEHAPARRRMGLPAVRARRHRRLRSDGARGIDRRGRCGDDQRRAGGAAVRGVPGAPALERHLAHRPDRDDARGRDRAAGGHRAPGCHRQLVVDRAVHGDRRGDQSGRRPPAELRTGPVPEPGGPDADGRKGHRDPSLVRAARVRCPPVPGSPVPGGAYGVYTNHIFGRYNLSSEPNSE